MLAAYVEIALAGHDLAAGRAGADELAEIARRYDAPLLHAFSRRASGSVLLAEGRVEAALARLRESWALFRELGAPYEEARTRLQIARACREAKDEDAVIEETSAARTTLQRLGAVPDLECVDSLLRKKAPRAEGALTEREIEVLRLIASGMTNRGIAVRLRISEKTVARHVSNIFVKLDLSSRSAATAYAFQHGLV